MKNSLSGILGYLVKVIPPFFRSNQKATAWRYMIFLLGLSGTLIGVQLWMSYANRDMMTSLSDKDSSGFNANILRYLLTIGVAIPVGVLYRYTEERFGLVWRQWMTNRLIKRYFFKRSYYQLLREESLDNPDQRISEDVKNFTAVSLSFGLIVLNSTVTLIGFMGVLYSISTTLVFVLLAYAVIGTLFTAFIGKKLVGINYLQYQKEADLRYGLVRVRDNAESIAFFRGEPRERLDLMHRLGKVVTNTFDLIGWNRNLAFFTSGYNYIALVVPLFVVAPLYLRGEIKFGVIAQATGAFAQVLAAMSLIITQFERLSSYAAGVVRLGGLWEALNGDENEDEDDPEITLQEGSSLVLKDLTVRPPKSERELVENLSLSLTKGGSLLIMGASGTGKSSLLRTISGLWNSGEGSIQRPQLKKMMFVPQKPYMIQGSLKDNILYPQRDPDITEDALKEALKKVNLEALTDRVNGDFNASLDWSNILSLGEQQRLSFARLLLYKPDLAFLDESTSALDEENEKALYGILKETGCSYVSVGHRSTLRAFHDNLLKIESEAKWTLTKSEEKTA